MSSGQAPQKVTQSSKVELGGSWINKTKKKREEKCTGASELEGISGGIT